MFYSSHSPLNSLQQNKFGETISLVIHSAYISKSITNSWNPLKTEFETCDEVRLPFLVHYAIAPKAHRFVLLNVLCTRRSLCPSQWYANWLWLLLDCFVHATLPIFVYHNWPNRIWISYRTVRIHRDHYFRIYTNKVSRALDKKCPHSSEWPALIAKIWSDPLPNKRLKMHFCQISLHIFVM